MITTILFDMGGTLEDIHHTPDTAKKACSQARKILINAGYLNEVPLPLFQERLEAGMQHYKTWSEQLFREKRPEEIWPNHLLAHWAFPPDIPDSFWEKLAGMWEVTYYHRTLRPGVHETLQTLQSLGLKIGVVSNTASLASVYDVLEDYGIRSFMQCVVLSSKTGYRKPDPKIFEIALKEIDSSASETIYVGDTRSRDIQGAVAAGLGASIQIQSALTPEKDPPGKPLPAPTFRVSSIPDILPAIQSLL